MKTSRRIKSALLGIILALVISPAWGQQTPNMKMSTEIPPGIATPDKLQTRIGTLTSFDGVPDKKTTQLVYDNLDLERATQAFLATDGASRRFAGQQLLGCDHLRT
jgi:hypothetical protein